MSILIFLLLGFLTSLLFPPYFFLPLGFLIFPFLCIFFEKEKKNLKKNQIFLYSFSFAFSFFLSLLFWLKNPFLVVEETESFYFISIFLIIILSLIFCFIFFLIIYFSKNLPLFFAVPLTFLISEYIISIFLYGFPWINFSVILSSSQYFSFSLKHYGTLISSYILIQIFCLPYLFLTKKKLSYELYYSLILIIFPLILVFFFNVNDIKNDNTPKKLDVEIFQLNFDIKYNEKKLKIILNSIAKSDSELLIFAENNYPNLIKDFNFEEIKNILKKNQTVIIGGTRIQNNNYYNSLLNITSSNVKYFDKEILVPFGEFLPLRSLFTFIEPISGPNDFSQGNSSRLIKIKDNLTYIPIICYEIIFYWKLINNLNTNSDFIVNITNDIWFGKVLGPYQHFYLSKQRAAEYNKPLIRVSNNGISGIINESGKILLNTNLNENQSMKFTLDINNNSNYYKNHLILKAYFLFIFIFTILINSRKKNGI